MLFDLRLGSARVLRLQSAFQPFNQHLQTPRQPFVNKLGRAQGILTGRASFG